MKNSLGERLQAIERKYKLTGPDVARLLGMDPRDYGQKYREHERPPTAWQSVALDMIDAHGIKTLEKRLRSKK